MSISQASLSVQAPLPSLASLTLKGLSQRDVWNQAKQNLSGLDLAQIHKPEVLRVLRALGVAPKPREWLFDKGLKQTLANHLISHAILQDAIQTFFLEHIMVFWHKLEIRSKAQTRALLRHETRALHAMFARNKEFNQYLKELNQKELRDYVDYQKAVLQDLIKQHHELHDLMFMMMGEFSREYVQFVHQDDILRTVFDGVADEKLEQYAEKYLEKRMKYEEKNQQLVDECEHELGQCSVPEPLKPEPRPQPQFNSQARLEELHANLQSAVEQLKQSEQEQERIKRFEQLRSRLAHRQEKFHAMPFAVAERCHFNSSVCANIIQNQTYVNTTFTDFCRPRIQPLMAVRHQMRANETCQANIRAHLEPIERQLHHGFSYKANELTCEPSPKRSKLADDLKLTR